MVRKSLALMVVAVLSATMVMFGASAPAGAVTTSGQVVESSSRAAAVTHDIVPAVWAWVNRYPTEDACETVGYYGEYEGKWRAHYCQYYAPWQVWDLYAYYD